MEDKIFEMIEGKKITYKKGLEDFFKAYCQLFHGLSEGSGAAASIRKWMERKGWENIAETVSKLEESDKEAAMDFIGVSTATMPEGMGTGAADWLYHTAKTFKRI